MADDIRQLIISPSSHHLAILTAHTVHICLLPDSSHLTSGDSGPMRPKIFTLGPTTHVTSRPSVVSALWHPLGVNGSCVVTVTADAMVRVWELSPSDWWSYDSPTTSIDLKKLADGRTLDQDFAASSSATNKAFSPDSFEMEVAAAAFATRGSGGWNPMTLWIAMREGDLYALCPLLPQRWAPPPTLIPSLSVSVVTTVASIEDDGVDGERLLAQQQLQWMGELDSQELQLVEGPPGEAPLEVYTRPLRPGAVPRLQGPFHLVSDPDTGDDLDTTTTDIVVIGKRIETDDLMRGEEDELDVDEGDREGSSLAVVCLLSTSGQVRIYLDLDGVQAQWLPPKSKTRPGRARAVAEPSLLAFQAIDTMSPVEVSDEAWPLFSTDVTSRYNLLVTHHAAITFVSLTPWIFRLEGELLGDHEAGTDFRIGLLVNSQSARDRIYVQPTADVAVPLAACVAVRDPELGYFLLSATPYEPVALTLETPDADAQPRRPDGSPPDREASMAPLEFHEPRPVFHPPHAFDQGSALPTLLERLRTSRHKTAVKQEVKLSPLTLQIFTDAHKVLSDETFRLGVAVAELFRCCELLRAELRQQVGKANEVKGKVDTIRGANRPDHEADNATYDRRIGEARDRQDRLARRMDGLRKLVGRATARELSAKERAFAEEVRILDACMGGGGGGDHEATQARQQPKQPWRRLEEVTSLQTELLDEAASLSEPGDAEAARPGGVKIPQDVRRSKLLQVQGLLSRETALVEALTERLERLQADV